MAKKAPTIEFYERSRGVWYFRAKAANGEIVAVGEDYTRRADVLRAIRAARRVFATAGDPIEVSE